MQPNGIAEYFRHSVMHCRAATPPLRPLLEA